MEALQDTVFVAIVWGLSALGVYQLAYLVRRYATRVGLLPARGRKWTAPTSDLTSPAEQLRRVMAATFTAKRVMSGREYEVFRTVEREAATCGRGYRVFAQTSLGEVLQSKDDQAFRSINSKRADVLVIDSRGYPVIAVEYQGSGHFTGTAAARDAVKKEALRKAGVELVEVFDSHSHQDAATAVKAALRRAAETHRDAVTYGNVAVLPVGGR